MKGFFHYKCTRLQLLLIPFVLLHGCATAPETVSFQMSGMTLNPPDKTVVEPRKINFVFEYEQVELTKSQRNRLLYLFDWQHGVIISYGKAQADSDYKALSIGHQRVQSVVQSLTQNQEIIQITFDPQLPIDSVLIKEKLDNPQLTRNEANDSFENIRL